VPRTSKKKKNSSVKLILGRICQVQTMQNLQSENSYSRNRNMAKIFELQVTLSNMSRKLRSRPIYRMLQKELYNFERLYKSNQKTCTVF
jgi:hypothetical protein